MCNSSRISVSRLVVFCVVAACSVDAQHGPPESDAVIAVIDGQAVSVRDVDSYSRSATPPQLYELNRQLQDPRHEEMEGWVTAQILADEAARLGLSVSHLVQERVTVEPVTEADVLWAIEKIRAQQPSAASSLESTTFEAAAPLIRRYLQGRRAAEARARYIRLLKQNPFAVDQGGQR